MKRVLVTGATGFVGRHAPAALLARGYEVHLIGRRKPDTLPANVTWHTADLLRPGASKPIIENLRPTHLLHLAWYAEHGKYWTSPENLRWVEASLALLRYFVESGGKRAVVAGTCAEYDWSSEHFDEMQTPSVPRTLYGSAKESLRQLATAYANAAGLSLAWGRIFFLYGPHEHEKRLVPSLIRPLLRGERATCRSGGHTRDLLHAADVADAFAALLDHAATQGLVNIASGLAVTLGEVAHTIGTIIGRPDLVQIEQAPGTPDNPLVMTAANHRISGTGWSPRFTLGSGLADAIAWHRQNLSVRR